MVVEVEQPVDGSLRNAETARQFGLSQARGMEGHIELSLCCVKRGQANHAMLPSTRLTGTRHHFALPDQLSNHGANFVCGLENRGVFHAIAPLSRATSGCSEPYLS